MSKRILISGASGFVGSHLTETLSDRGDKIVVLSRSAKSTKKNIIHWNPTENEIDLDQSENIDAVVHLAGENIAGRWTEDKKARIENSRILGTTESVDIRICNWYLRGQGG
jgi:NAD dependent epimerase/dehydratase family enzyme